ncbi:MAG: stalk domain-containing protein, partial [Oscillospiraceae bacterium]
MKKFLLTLLLLIMFVMPFNGFALENINTNDLVEVPDLRVWLNGKYLEFDQKPIEENGEILVPLRKIFEDFGTKVEWINESETVILTHDDVVIKLKIGENVALLNEKEIPLSVPAKVLNDRTCVPLKFISDSMGASVDFDPVNKTAIISYAPKELEVATFNLGEKAVTMPNNDNFKFEIIGGLSVPKTQNNPVVLVIHGSHKVEDVNKNRYDLGYSYLLKELSKNGYLALSVNANLEYSLDHGENSAFERLNQIVDANIEKLESANNGENVGYGLEISGKADMSNISILGHSVGGQGAFFVAKEQIKKGRNVKSIISLAPAMNSEMLDRDLPNIPSGIIIPQYDDDVTSLDGQGIFNKIKTKNETYTQLTYLYGADHNSFNEAILTKGLSPIPEESKSYDSLTKFQHRDFLSKYVLNFLNFNNKKEPLDACGFDYNLEAPGKMYGYDVLTSLSQAKAIRILHNKDLNITATNARIKDVISSSVLSENTAGAFYPPGLNSSKFKSIEWDENGSITIPVSEDFSKYRVLNFDIAQDSSDTKNNQKNQAITLVLKDKSGKTERIN